jgi:hypothetical protein
MNFVIAFACAVEPLAIKVCLPPQSTLAPAAYASVAWALLHAEPTMAAVASKLMAVADRLCFTLIASRRWWRPASAASSVSGYTSTFTATELTGKPTTDERVINWADRRFAG